MTLLIDAARLVAGRFSVASLERADQESIIDLDARYADLELGLADCALVVLAARHRTTRILSFDERHFRAVAPLRGGEAFTILPSRSPCACTTRALARG